MVLSDELSIVKACKRCCLRALGVRQEISYLTTATAQAHLASLQLEQLRGSNTSAHDIQEQELAEEKQSSGRKRKLDGDGQCNTAGAADRVGLLTAATEPAADQAARLASGSDSATQQRPCPVCLGALQDPGSSGKPTLRLSTSLTEGNAAQAQEPADAREWAPPALHDRGCSSLEEAAGVIAAEWEFGSFALDISLPAATAVRAHALLRRLPKEPPPDIVDLKEAVRMVYGAQLASLLGRPMDAASEFRIVLRCTHEETEQEGCWLAGAPPPRKARWHTHGGGQAKEQGSAADAVLASAAVLQRLLALPDTEFSERCPPTALQLKPPCMAAAVLLSCMRQPVYIAGRYRKLRRDVPQSRWVIDGERKGSVSVEEVLAAALLPALAADGHTFMAAGREDMDVRMLGSGRPFILEIHSARRGMPPPEALREMEAAVARGSSGVEVAGLRAADASLLEALKSGEQEKQKTYSAVVWLPRPLRDADLELLESTAELMVQQQTPIRVLQRRANLARSRTVHEMHAARLHGQVQYLSLRLRTQAGMYIKEFVHGDLGRTRPSVSDMLCCRAQLVRLDVVEVHLDLDA